MRYSTEPKYRKHVEGYGFLTFFSLFFLSLTTYVPYVTLYILIYTMVLSNIEAALMVYI